MSRKMFRSWDADVEDEADARRKKKEQETSQVPAERGEPPHHGGEEQAEERASKRKSEGSGQQGRKVKERQKKAMKDDEALHRIALALDALVSIKLWELRDHPPTGTEIVPVQPIQDWLHRERS